MGGAALVADVPGEGFFFHKSAGEDFGIGEQSAAVVAYVYDESVGGGEVGEHEVEVAFANAVFERLVVHVAYVVLQYLVVDAVDAPIVEVEVVFADEPFVVVGRVLFPNPVARHVEGRHQIGVTVLEGLEHVAEHAEEFFGSHRRRNLGGIFGLNGLPINAFVFEKAVVFVENCPECFEIALRIVGIFLHIMA